MTMIVAADGNTIIRNFGASRLFGSIEPGKDRKDTNTRCPETQEGLGADRAWLGCDDDKKATHVDWA